jgi:hypothetical protein
MKWWRKARFGMFIHRGEVELVSPELVKHK